MGTGDRLDVDPERVRTLGQELDRITAELMDSHATTRDAALAAYGQAVPPSDLSNALAFFWGRWSQVLQDGEDTARFLGTVAQNASGSYERTDRNIVL
jgi:hypothetical protein